jgi:transposase
MERIEMSQEERDKLEWLKRAKDGVISQREAARRMGVSDRWVRKLLKRMKRQGDCVVVHGLRGRASNRRIATKVQAQAIELLKQPDWHDFGPTFASEQLAKRHGIELSDETLRGWMIEAGLWKPGARRIEEVHGWRPRRSAWRTPQSLSLENRNSFWMRRLKSSFSERSLPEPLPIGMAPSPVGTRKAWSSKPI